MFLRLVQARAQPNKTSEIRDVYDAKIIPTLQETPGCLFACLIQAVEHTNVVGSLTLWESQADAEAYTKAGTFQTLLDSLGRFLIDSSEMRIKLSSDLKLEYTNDTTEADITEYPVSIDLPMKQKGTSTSPSLYIRIVSVFLKPEHRDEYYSLYIKEIIPALQEAEGCIHTYLVMPPKGRKNSLSVTVWESKAHADAYEEGGQFRALISKVKHTFNDLIQWKLELDPDKRAASASGEDIDVQGYSVLTLKDFGASF
jgi:quinol monooxygenase YgiN